MVEVGQSVISVKKSVCNGCLDVTYTHDIAIICHGEVKQISKDKSKARILYDKYVFINDEDRLDGVYNKVVSKNIEGLKTSENELLETFKNIQIPPCDGFMVTFWSGKDSLYNIYRADSISIVYLEEDDYDDVIHIKPEGRFEIPYSAKKALDIPDGIVIRNYVSSDSKDKETCYYFKSLESMAHFLADYYDLKKINETTYNFSVKFDNFLKENGREGLNIDDFKDYLGDFDDLEWAMDNKLTIEDFDEWQAVQRVVKYKLDYRTANEIATSLANNDISIFDCES